ncbi:pyridoxamine 5'-phosphate oxidase [Salinibacterium sp. SWN1162]|uniref:pyridoxamine 5'-phosphate oxidase n=1 Tax=Salinibacterium sp. SWN1162 TaxID=2792053 RepID=UPI0018CE95BE|nr:pyridoxamine 5'-phosphate oxidase [Salinibacterium sp. SWN1162]MBH0008700.1 pyridoxamine 5'-phosphate oxidase [Salinibacterium sp. SWN1162]
MSDPLSQHTDYGQLPLNDSDVLADPIDQFRLWLDNASEAAVYEPNAMVLSTVDADGSPSARTVLLRAIDEAGFEFFTNYSSIKGQALLANPAAALVFPWYSIHRQVLVQGTARPVAAALSDDYFATRPRGSQIAAHASEQSQPIASRALLEQRVTELEAEFEGRDVPRPADWGGFVVEPHSIEFWQGRSSRLHDRVRFGCTESGGWERLRLQP